jgi:hypothetical protein
MVRISKVKHTRGFGKPPHPFRIKKDKKTNRLLPGVSPVKRKRFKREEVYTGRERRGARGDKKSAQIRDGAGS